MARELASERSSGVGRTMTRGERGLATGVEARAIRVVRRFGGKSGRRGECANPPGRRLPVFFATRLPFPPGRIGVITGTATPPTVHVPCQERCLDLARSRGAYPTAVLRRRDLPADP